MHTLRRGFVLHSPEHFKAQALFILIFYISVFLNSEKKTLSKSFMCYILTRE